MQMINYLKHCLSRPAAIKATAGNKINLLIELDTFDKGGLQKVVLDCAVRLDPGIFGVTIVSINGTGHLAEVAEKKGIRAVSYTHLTLPTKRIV